MEERKVVMKRVFVLGALALFLVLLVGACSAPASDEVAPTEAPVEESLPQVTQVTVYRSPT